MKEDPDVGTGRSDTQSITFPSLSLDPLDAFENEPDTIIEVALALEGWIDGVTAGERWIYLGEPQQPNRWEPVYLSNFREGTAAGAREAVARIRATEWES